MSNKGLGHYLTLAKGHSDLRVKACVSQKETVESFGTKFHMKAYGRMGMKIHTNE